MKTGKVVGLVVGMVCKPNCNAQIFDNEFSWGEYLTGHQCGPSSHGTCTLNFSHMDFETLKKPNIPFLAPAYIINY